MKRSTPQVNRARAILVFSLVLAIAAIVWTAAANQTEPRLRVLFAASETTVVFEPDSVAEIELFQGSKKDKITVTITLTAAMRAQFHDIAQQHVGSRIVVYFGQEVVSDSTIVASVVSDALLFTNLEPALATDIWEVYSQ